MKVHEVIRTTKYGSVEWGVVDDSIHDTINRDYYISCRSSSGGVTTRHNKFKGVK